MRNNAAIILSLACVLLSNAMAQSQVNPVIALMQKTIQQKGIVAAIEAYREIRADNEQRYEFDEDQLLQVASSLPYENINDRKQILDLNLEFFNDSPKTYWALAHLYYENNQMKQARDILKKMPVSDDPEYLRNVILRKRLFFVPEDFEVPAGFSHEKFVFEPIGAEHAEMDYKAVMSSVDHLTGVLGRQDWPGNLTLEEDRNALAGHEWEFTNRVGFVYTVLNPEKTAIIGCIYIYPSRLDNYDSEVVFWVTAEEFDRGLDDILFTTVKSWLADKWPFRKIIFPSRNISWGEFFTKLDRQDTKYIIK